MSEATRPTDAELEILKVLWERESATVQEVHDAIGEPRGVRYTTILKLLQVMHGKSLVKRDDSRRQHVYQAAIPRQSMERSLVRDLVDRLFSGSSVGLVQHALSGDKVSRKDLTAIRELLKDMEAK
jgi:BlaI family transcriptional regulator, penicillinase repressor